MHGVLGEEYEVSAARTQSVFRAVNEQMTQLTATLSNMAETQTIACECATFECVETLEIEPGEYRAVRSDPQRFAVRAGHVLPDAERVVTENQRFVVVETPRVAAHAPRPTGGW